MMTRKDYIAVSAILFEYKKDMTEEAYLDLCSDFANYMEEDNPRFRHDAFFRSCEANIPKEEYPAPKPALSHVALA
jgi:hypothetical protein